MVSNKAENNIKSCFDEETYDNLYNELSIICSQFDDIINKLKPESTIDKKNCKLLEDIVTEIENVQKIILQNSHSIKEGILKYNGEANNSIWDKRFVILNHSGQIIKYLRSGDKIDLLIDNDWYRGRMEYMVNDNYEGYYFYNISEPKIGHPFLKEGTRVRVFSRNIL